MEGRKGKKTRSGKQAVMPSEHVSVQPKATEKRGGTTYHWVKTYMLKLLTESLLVLGACKHVPESKFSPFKFSF